MRKEKVSTFYSQRDSTLEFQSINLYVSKNDLILILETLSLCLSYGRFYRN